MNKSKKKATAQLAKQILGKITYLIFKPLLKLEICIFNHPELLKLAVSITIGITIGIFVIIFMIHIDERSEIQKVRKIYKWLNFLFDIIDKLSILIIIFNIYHS